MNIELICKTIIEINNSWVHLAYFKDITTVFIMLFILLILLKCVNFGIESTKKDNE